MDRRAHKKIEDEAAQELLALTKEGKAEIFLVLGPPRCGTTATEKFLLDLEIDGQVNEPRLLVPDIGYVSNSKKQILDKVRELHATGIACPKLVVKHTCRFIELGGEIEYWNRLCKHILLLPRNPALSMESLIIMQMNTFKQKDLGEHLNLDKLFSDSLPKKAKVGDNQESWQAYLDHSQQERDYSDLNDLFGFNDLAKSEWWNQGQIKEVLKLCLETMKEKDGAQAIEKKFAESSYGSEKKFWQKINRVSKVTIAAIPDFLVDGLLDARAGNWTIMGEHHKALQKSCDHYSIIDFSDVQLDPVNSLRLIAQRMGLKIRDESGKKPEFDPNRVSPVWPKEFHPFAQALKHTSIQPPDKAPIKFKNFPVHIQRALQPAFKHYLELVKDPNRIDPFVLALTGKIDIRLANGGRYEGLDPITCYAHLIGTDPKKAAALQKGNRDYAPYFTMISDISQAKKSVTSIGDR